MKFRIIIAMVASMQLGLISLCLPAVSSFSSEHYNSTEYLKRVKSEPVQYPELTEDNAIIQWLNGTITIKWKSDQLKIVWIKFKNSIDEQRNRAFFLYNFADYLKKLVQTYQDTIECPLNDYMCLTRELFEKFKHQGTDRNLTPQLFEKLKQQNQDLSESVDMYQQCITSVLTYLSVKEYGFFRSTSSCNPQPIIMSGLVNQPFPIIYDAAARLAQELLECIYNHKHFSIINKQ